MNKNKKILVCGYSYNENPILQWLDKNRFTNVNYIGPEVDIGDLYSDNYNLVISYGYRKKIDPNILKCPAINLHMSLLPWNRGSHPNFWSFWDDTLKGVSIHLIDSGIDTGPVVLSKLIEDEKFKGMTLKESYLFLKRELEHLFLTNFNLILEKTYKLYSFIPEHGSIHYKKDLDKVFNYLPNGWDTKIEDVYMAKVEYTIDQVTEIRKKNNNIWMNLLKIALKSNREEAQKILSQININDQEINKHLKTLV